VRWRKHIGEDGMEWLPTETIEAGRKSGAVDRKALDAVAVDTTAMEKATAHPTDSRPCDRARVRPADLRGEAGVTLRQSCARLTPRLAAQVGRHAHAERFKRVRKALRTPKGYAGGVLRDLRRHLRSIPEGPLRERACDALAPTSQPPSQPARGGGRLHARREPEVDRISKGKARVRYEFGCKASVATTVDGGFVVGMLAMPGNPHDGHTLAEAPEQVAILTDHAPSRVVVDRGHRGHGGTGPQVPISGARRGLTSALAKLLRRRGRIEPEIGHMKSDGRPARCAPKGTIADALFAVLCDCGHNIRRILAHPRALLRAVVATIPAIITPPRDRHVACSAA
jgi:IS5 family transposase